MFHPELLARFTTHLKEALQKGLLFSIRNGRSLLEPGDVLVGLLQEQGSIATEILGKFHVDLHAAEEAFALRALAAPAGSNLHPDLSPATKRLLEKCVLSAHLSEHKYVGTEHLLWALIEIDSPEITAFLRGCGVSTIDAKQQVETILKSTARFPDLSRASDSTSAQDHDVHEHDEETPDREPAVPGSAQSPRRQERVKSLEVFARELSSPEVVEKLDPVIGRDLETERVIEILCRRTKNNPLLLGEPGVGKTAVVEGLAQRMAAGDVPDSLQGRRLYALDLTLMVAGTMYRGEFEARLKQLIEEVKADPNILLFIDEIHTMVGAGSTSGSMDAANILKPALARGEIHCIGATTWNEYKKHIEPDAALERRYQPVHVLEPTPEKALEMVRGLKTRYEDHHAVTFSEAALEASVRLAARHITDRAFPDKAIDLLDGGELEGRTLTVSIAKEKEHFGFGGGRGFRGRGPRRGRGGRPGRPGREGRGGPRDSRNARPGSGEPGAFPFEMESTAGTDCHGLSHTGSHHHPQLVRRPQSKRAPGPAEYDLPDDAGVV
jgi:ATP-dependent Clp protease ATP-binding subunit ClpC